MEFEATLEHAAGRVDEARIVLDKYDAGELHARGYLEVGDQCRICEAVHFCPAAQEKKCKD